ncbi:LPS export ABC transporter periplasmic protein LptC [bacterium]|nr:LPS export ABC transporter periplasmic protein LptC [bacterium]
MKLNILWVTLLVSLACVSTCTKQQELNTNEANLDVIPDQESWNAAWTTTNHGVVTSIIHYGYMQKFTKKRTSTFLEGVEIELYNSDGDRTSVLNAQEAELYESERQFEMIGNVVARSKDGFTLRTQRLTWEDFHESISSKEVVQVITAEGDTINGVGFKSDKFFKNWTITKPWGTTQKKLNLDVVETDENSDQKN